jgi:hypothetical protein
MADFLAPRQGGRYIGTAALPATVWFDLSTKSVDSTNPFTHASTTATRGALTHAGFSTYNALSKARPTGASSLGGTFVFGTITWSNGAVPWPSNVRSIVATTGSAAGTLLACWNLQVGGGARDMSAPSTTENVNPTLIIKS